MAHTPCKPLANWLKHRSGHLDGLLSRVERLRQLTAALHTGLPKPLASHCRAANLDGETLVVGCDTAAWATKLRYALPQLLQYIQGQAGLPPISRIQVRVQPFEHPQPAASLRRILLSERSAAIISSFADNIDDPALKAALCRLGQRVKVINKH